ncbi:MAG: DNA cytosine methyltransferase [Planctomycetota bacterium]
MKLSIGSLFSGIGGLEYGLENTGGFLTKWQVECDPYAYRVLKRHWPKAQRCRDIFDFPPSRPEDWRVDVITGGFPCQPVSLAGKQKGDADERWLWKEMLRVCETLRPRWIVAENVRGLLSAGDGRLFGAILRDLANVGYCVEWSLISSCSVGSPHPRERLFVVAYPDGDGLERGIGWTKEDGQIRELPSTGHACDSATRRRRWWKKQLPTPVFCRGSNGIPSRVDRTRCLGNAVVPQVAEWIGHRILEIEHGPKELLG